MLRWRRLLGELTLLVSHIRLFAINLIVLKGPIRCDVLWCMCSLSKLVSGPVALHI